MAPANNNSNGDKPELNPLLNPVLGAHLGRWAEVYFTSAPENREEAVLELLRELQSGAAPGSSSTARQTPQSGLQGSPAMPQWMTAPIESKADPQASNSPASNYEEAWRPAVPAEEAAGTPIGGQPWANAQPNETVQDWRVCNSCGGRNTPANRFCGLCGVQLRQPHDVSSPNRDIGASQFAVEPENSVYRENNPNGREPLRQEVRGYEGQGQQSRVGSVYGDENSESEDELHRRELDEYLRGLNVYGDEAEQRRREIEQEQALSNWPERPAVPSLIPDIEPSPYRYRIYVGLVIGILIGALVYIAWRSSAIWSNESHPLPQAAPMTSDQNPPPAPPKQPATPSANNSTSATANKAEEKSAQDDSEDPQSGAEARELPPRTKPGPSESQAASLGQSAASSQGNGSEELAIAEGYLNGSQGRERNSSEAAKWLWRSLGKQNAAATLLLSDLYVRGDGVPKSCDQARLLLDAAARKGSPGAAERIKNLPSLGCP